MLTPNSTKKHYLGLSFTESPHNVHKQRKHFNKQYRDHFFLADCQTVERVHPLVRTSTAAQTRIHIDLSEERPKKENLKGFEESGRKTTIDKYFKKRPKAS